MPGAVAVMVLIKVKPSARLWGLMRFVIGRFALGRTPGLKFFKILGSGHEGGFGLKPSADRQGLFCVFQTAAHADAFLNESPVIQSYRQHAQEFFVTKLAPYSSRGSWAGMRLEAHGEEPQGLIATLTRASIRPSKAKAFWAKAPPAEVSLHAAQGCILSTGLGEAPFFRQATFSLWENAHAMNAYARTGAHLAAIQAAHQGQYFSESMFVRFIPIAPQGLWKGQRIG
jgi:hypothetical protein